MIRMFDSEASRLYVGIQALDNSERFAGESQPWHYPFFAIGKKHSVSFDTLKYYVKYHVTMLFIEVYCNLLLP